MSEYLFVYGSLRRQMIPQNLQVVMTTYCQFVGEAWVAGQLYEIAGYPGAIPSTHNDLRVQGELYQIILPSLNLFTILDRYEECSAEFLMPHEYSRCQTTVHCASGEVLTAWIYWYNRQTTSLKMIHSGDYC